MCTRIICLSLFSFNSRTAVFLNWYKPNPSPLFFCCAIYVRDARYSSMIQLTYRELWISFKMLDRMPCSSNFKRLEQKEEKRHYSSLTDCKPQQISGTERSNLLTNTEFQSFIQCFSAVQNKHILKDISFYPCEGNTISEPTQWCKTRGFWIVVENVWAYEWSYVIHYFPKRNTHTA